MSAWRLFTSFLIVGVTSLGGAGSAHLEELVVRRRAWVSERDFLEALTLARALPGTNVSNLAAFLGSALAGFPGALAGVSGVVLPGALVVLGGALAYERLGGIHGPLVESAFRGVTAGAVGVMASLVARAARTGLGGWVAPPFAAAAFVGVVVLRWNVLLVLVALVPLASLLESRLARRARD